MELSLLISFVSSFQLGVVVATKQRVLHAAAAMDLRQSKRSAITGLRTIATNYPVPHWIATDQFLVLNISSLLLLLEHWPVGFTLKCETIISKQISRGLEHVFCIVFLFRGSVLQEGLTRRLLRENVDTSAHLPLHVVLLLSRYRVILEALHLMVDRVHRRLAVAHVDRLVGVRS